MPTHSILSDFPLPRAALGRTWWLMKAKNQPFPIVLSSTNLVKRFNTKPITNKEVGQNFLRDIFNFFKTASAVLNRMHIWSAETSDRYVDYKQRFTGHYNVNTDIKVFVVV
jgi:hypothetical protein